MSYALITATSACQATSITRATRHAGRRPAQASPAGQAGHRIPLADMAHDALGLLDGLGIPAGSRGREYRWAACRPIADRTRTSADALACQHYEHQRRPRSAPPPAHARSSLSRPQRPCLPSGTARPSGRTLSQYRTHHPAAPVFPCRTTPIAHRRWLERSIHPEGCVAAIARRSCASDRTPATAGYRASDALVLWLGRSIGAVAWWP